MHGGINFWHCPESEWRDNFRMSKRNFYELCDMLRPCLQRKKNLRLRRAITAKKMKFSIKDFFIKCNQIRKCFFRDSRTLISSIIRKVLYAVTNFLEP